MSRDKLIRVSEIFGPTIQGEGALIGRPTVFVRTGGCDYRCSWCDSLHAVLPEYRSTWTPMTPEAIADGVAVLAGQVPCTVTISGGNPAMQPLAALLQLFKQRGYDTAMETQGSLWRDWYAEVTHLIVSPKPPSSGMTTNWDHLAAIVEHEQAHMILKVVVFDDADYDYAIGTHLRFPAIPFYLSVGNDDVTSVDTRRLTERVLGRMAWLVEKVLADKYYEITVLPQLHTLIWGNARGV